MLVSGMHNEVPERLLGQLSLRLEGLVSGDMVLTGGRAKHAVLIARRACSKDGYKLSVSRTRWVSFSAFSTPVGRQSVLLSLRTVGRGEPLGF